VGGGDRFGSLKIALLDEPISLRSSIDMATGLLLRRVHLDTWIASVAERLPTFLRGFAGERTSYEVTFLLHLSAFTPLGTAQPLFGAAMR
jgi:hypothetical protein